MPPGMNTEALDIRVEPEAVENLSMALVILVTRPA